MSNLKIPRVETYEQAIALPGRVAHNTTSLRDGESVRIFYHGNEIVRWYPNGVRLSNAGWFTVTTMARLRALQPHPVKGKKETWAVNGHRIGYGWTPLIPVPAA